LRLYCAETCCYFNVVLCYRVTLKNKLNKSYKYIKRQADRRHIQHQHHNRHKVILLTKDTYNVRSYTLGTRITTHLTQKTLHHELQRKQCHELCSTEDLLAYEI
jgi:hypothetical protein